MKSSLRRFVSFCFAGSLGFTVDAGLCKLFVTLFQVSPFHARIVSIIIAMLVTWLINRTLTFGRSSSPPPIEWLKYVGVTSFGATVNYLVFALCIALVPKLGIFPAVAAGSLAGLFFNYQLSHRLVFTKAKASA